MDGLGKARLLAVLVPAALLGGAYVAQYGFGLFPCEMCWWQRYPHFAALGFAGLAFVMQPARVWTALAGLAVITSGLIGGLSRRGRIWLVAGNYRLCCPAFGDRRDERLRRAAGALRCRPVEPVRHLAGGVQFPDFLRGGCGHCGARRV